MAEARDRSFFCGLRVLRLFSRCQLLRERASLPHMLPEAAVSKKTSSAVLGPSSSASCPSQGQRAGAMACLDLCTRPVWTDLPQPLSSIHTASRGLENPNLEATALLSCFIPTDEPVQHESVQYPFDSN